MGERVSGGGRGLGAAGAVGDAGGRDRGFGAGGAVGHERGCEAGRTGAMRSGAPTGRAPELLAPAGTPDALRAAVAAGADAVYLGLGAFNARAANDGFTLEELARGCRLAHAHGARVYVTLNAYVHDHEIPEAVALAGRALDAGADALIVADAGLMRALRAVLPNAELHLSTQAGVQEAAGARLAAHELGASRVTCARELSLEELAELCAAGVPIEAFCHGAICVCYSGACAFSALSAQSGLAPCPSIDGLRIDVRGASLSERSAQPISRGEGTNGVAPLSGQPARAGGRGGVPASTPCPSTDGQRETSGASRSGRSAQSMACGRAAAGDAGALSEQLAQDDGRAADTGDFPSLASADAREARRSANRGDCTQPCRMAYALEDASGRVLAGGSDADAGDRLLCPHDYCSLAYVPELVRMGVAALKIEGRMKNPDYVYNVVRCYRAAIDAAVAGRACDAAVLEAQLRRSFNRGLTDAYLRGHSGAELMSTERSINQGVAVGAIAERRHEEVVVALGRGVAAGDTLEIRSTPGADAPRDVPKRWPMVPCPVDAAAGERIVVHCKRKVEVGSPVHVVRSAEVLADAQVAVAAMRAEEERLCGPMLGARERLRTGAAADPAGAERLFAPTGASIASPAGSPSAEQYGASALEVPVVVERPDQAAQALETAPAGCVYVHAHRLLEADAAAWGPLLPRLVVILDEVHRSADVSRVRALCDRAAAVVCRNLGQIEIARAAGIPWEAAVPLSVWSAETSRWLHGLGARRVWLPDELSAAEARAIADRLAGELPVIAPAGTSSRPPQLMVTEHCLLTAEGPCTGDGCGPGACASCPRRLASQRGDRFLVELSPSGRRLPIRVDALGRTRIYRDRPCG